MRARLVVAGGVGVGGASMSTSTPRCGPPRTRALPDTAAFVVAGGVGIVDNPIVGAGIESSAAVHITDTTAAPLVWARSW